MQHVAYMANITHVQGYNSTTPITFHMNENYICALHLKSIIKFGVQPLIMHNNIIELYNSVKEVAFP